MSAISEVTGLYWLPPVGTYIISDHPLAELLKREYPDFPCLTLAELEAMPRLPEPTKLFDGRGKR